MLFDYLVISQREPDSPLFPAAIGKTGKATGMARQLVVKAAQERFEFRLTFLYPCGTVLWRLRQRSNFRARGRTTGRRNQITVRVGVAAAGFKPDVLGTQRCPQFPQRAQLVVAPI